MNFLKHKRHPCPARLPHKLRSQYHQFFNYVPQICSPNCVCVMEKVKKGIKGLSPKLPAFRVLNSLVFWQHMDTEQQFCPPPLLPYIPRRWKKEVCHLIRSHLCVCRRSFFHILPISPTRLRSRWVSITQTVYRVVGSTSKLRIKELLQKGPMWPMCMHHVHTI